MCAAKEDQAPDLCIANAAPSPHLNDSRHKKSGCKCKISGIVKNAVNDVNLLTEIRLQHYSDGMISEFQQLSQKIDQLAELTQSLRRENAALRLDVSALTADNLACAERMQQAYRRVAALLEKVPAAQSAPDEELT
jgi:outer membrane murein-binding lipoprotein Lpp